MRSATITLAILLAVAAVAAGCSRREGQLGFTRSLFFQDRSVDCGGRPCGFRQPMLVGSEVEIGVWTVDRKCADDLLCPAPRSVMANLAGASADPPGVITHDVSSKPTWYGANLKVRGISPGTAAPALAANTGAALVTCDHRDLDPVDATGVVPFHWIR